MAQQRPTFFFFLWRISVSLRSQPLGRQNGRYSERGSFWNPLSMPHDYFGNESFTRILNLESLKRYHRSTIR